MNDEKIEKIQQELKQLSQKQVEFSKAHQQQFFLYRWLQGPDPELESVKEDKRRLYDILQAAASAPPPVPEVDWSKSTFYWKRLAKFGLITPAEQFNAYTSFAGGMVGLDMLPQTFTEPIISLNSLIARKKLKNGLIIGLEPEQPPSKLSWLRTGLKDSNSEGFLAWGPPCCLFFICGQKESSRMPLLFVTRFCQLKNKNRFNK